MQHIIYKLRYRIKIFKHFKHYEGRKKCPRVICVPWVAGAWNTVGILYNFYIYIYIDRGSSLTADFFFLNAFCVVKYTIVVGLLDSKSVNGEILYSCVI